MDIIQNVIGSVSLSYLIVFLTHLYNLYLNENEAQEILLNPGGEIGMQCSWLQHLLFSWEKASVATYKLWVWPALQS